MALQGLVVQRAAVWLPRVSSGIISGPKTGLLGVSDVAHHAVTMQQHAWNFFKTLQPLGCVQEDPQARVHHLNNTCWPHR